MGARGGGGGGSCLASQKQEISWLLASALHALYPAGFYLVTLQ